MKKIYFIFCLVLALNQVNAQSDNCSGAVALTIGSCVSGSPGATQNIAGCTGNANDDAWYKFVATQTSHMINVTGSAGFDPVIQAFSGTCASLSSLGCVDNTFTAQTENLNLSGLTIGATYYLRIYDYYATAAAGTFTTCVTVPPPAPSNNFCTNAIALTVNSSCVNTNTTSYGATMSMAGCVGNADDDVWFSFTATNYTQTIQVSSSGGMDAVVELFSGTCAALTSIQCEDAGFTNGTETINATGLNPGSTYFIRVYDYYSTGGYPFSICITGNSIIAGSQPNDNPCSAITLPPVTSDCNYLTFSTTGATSTGAGLAPTPASCAGGSGAMIGGFSASSHDVWFAITVPASGKLYITPQPNQGAGYITDGVMALYSGACGSLTQIQCADDYTSYPGSANDLLPYIAASGLTPGATVYLRYWGFGTAQGDFGLCVQSPTNDNCANALYICDINGYSSSTSSAYTADRPGTGTGQMFGNNETAAGVNQVDGVNTGGPFGYYPYPGTTAGPYSSPALDVNIENNSWIKFTAGSTTANLRVTIGNCWVGAYPSGGIQMQIFSGTNCNGFVPVSSFREGSNTFTVTANGLTMGNDYYLMVDGYAGDICNYTIQAINGVALPAIVAVPEYICPGQSSILTAPLGATGYTWYPNGETTRTISVTPGTTMTYTCIAGGVCGNKQTLTKTVTINPVPNVLINSGSPISTCGTQTTTLTASGATTFTWNTTATTTSISVSPSVTTTYSVIGTAAATGCTNTAITTITVNPIPSFTLNSSATNTICFGKSTVLTATGTATGYTWSPGGAATSITVSPTSTQVYNVTGTNAEGCSKIVSTTITVNSLPTVSSSSTTICDGKTGTLTASGTASTYTWSTGTSATSITVSPTLTTTYTLTGTSAANCTNTAVGQVSVNALPNITANSGTICNNQTYTITAGGANTYTWSTSQNGTSISVTPTTTTVYTVTGTAVTTCTNVNTATVTVNALPQLVSTPSISPSNCGASTGSITNVSVTGAPTLTYTWTNSVNTTTVNTPNIGNQPAGTYNLQVQDGNNCINNFGPYSISNPGAPAAPSASATANSICVGNTINLFASAAGGTYNWSGPNSFTTTTQNPSITNATTGMSGVYSVYTTSAGCSGPATNVTVTVNSLPTPNATASQTAFCVGNNVNLFGSSSSTYTWTGPGTYTSNVQNPSITNISIGSNGIYTLAVTDANNCQNTATVAVNVNANPTASASANPNAICAGEPINLSASGGTIYNWSGPNGYSNGTQSPTILNGGTVQSGNYTVTVTDANSCSSTAVASVSVNALPSYTWSANANNICYGNDIQLNAGSNSYTYVWTGPNTYSANGAGQTITNASPLNSGTYTITASDLFCSQNQTIAINVYPQIVMNASANGNIVCTGTTINLLGTGGGIYSWNGPNGFSSNSQNPQINNAQSNASGIYSLTVTDNTTNCTEMDTVLISIAPTPSLVAVTNDSTCFGGALTLSANFGSGVSVTWYSDAALTNTVQVNSNTYQPTITSDGVYVYYAQGTVGSCVSSVATVTAQYNNINAAASANVYSGNSPLNVNFTNNSTGVTATDNYSWTFGDGNGSNLMDPTNIFNNEGTYNVVLTVTDLESGCIDTATIIIKVEDEVIILVPNVFTPNGDGSNDAFHLKLQGVKSAEGNIFNRWGQLLFSWDALNSAWDGKANNGEECPDATYYYIIKVIDKKDKEYTFPGYVLIIR